MRNLKRVLSLALAAIMLMGMMVMGTSAASVSDFNDADQIGNVEAASIVTGLGIFAGDTSGNFDPQRPVTRAEMATVICKILYGSDVNGDNFKGTGTFADAKTYQGGWAEGYINMCKSQGIVSGYNDTTFGAADTVTTWQAALMLQRALGYWAPAAGESISELTVTEKATRLGLYGDLTLSVDEPLTRENVAVLVFNTLFAQRVEFRNGNYVKASDFNVVPTTSIDEMNTLAQNTFGLYSVDGVVTENGYTNMYLTDKSKVVFDDSKDVTGDSKVEAEYTFDYETGLDLIGHAVTVYYRIDRKAPAVYTVVDQAEKVEVTTVGDNFSTTARNAGFSRDTSDTQIVLNYNLEDTVEDYTDYSSDPVILISNSSNLVVDYAIVVDQELDYVTNVRVNNADRDNPITTYSMTVLNSKTDDTNVVALNDIEKDQYVITVMIEGRGINDSDLYLIKAAETEQEIITKVTRKLNATEGLASAGMDYNKSAVWVDGGLKELSKSAIIPYVDVESKGEYILVFDDFFRNLIGVYPLTEEREVNYAYVAQFGHTLNAGGSLNDKYVLNALIYFADGSSGVYPVDTGTFEGNLFKGSVAANGNWTPSSGGTVAMNVLNGVEEYSDHGSSTTPANPTGYGVYQDATGKIGLYNVKITDSGKARITAIPSTSISGTDATPAAVNTLRKGVTYLGDDLYANSNTVFFLVDGKYDGTKIDNGLTVKVITGVADMVNVGVLTPSTNDGGAAAASKIKLHWVDEVDPDDGYGLTAAASDDALVAELFTSKKTNYNAVDAVLIAGYKVAPERGDTVYFYDGYYTITKNNGKWDLEVQVYNASTGEDDIISYSGYDTDLKAREPVENLKVGYYVESGSKFTVLTRIADAANEGTTTENNSTLNSTTDSNLTYVVTAGFEYFTKQGDILTLYTDKNTNAYGVIASEAEIVDLTGNRIDSLQELSDLIESRTEVYKDNKVGAPSPSAVLSFRFGENNKVDFIFITEVMKPYDKDYTGTGSDNEEEGVQNEKDAREVTLVGNTVTVNYVDGKDIPVEIATTELAKLGYTLTKYDSTGTLEAVRNGVTVAFTLSEVEWYEVTVDETLVGYMKSGEDLEGIDLSDNSDKGDKVIESTDGGTTWAISSLGVTDNETITGANNHLAIKTGYVAFDSYTIPTVISSANFDVTYQLNSETAGNALPDYARKGDTIKVIVKAKTGGVDYSVHTGGTNGSITAASGATLSIQSTNGAITAGANAQSLNIVAGKIISAGEGFTLTYEIDSATSDITVPAITYVAPTGP